MRKTVKPTMFNNVEFNYFATALVNYDVKLTNDADGIHVTSTNAAKVTRHVVITKDLQAHAHIARDYVPAIEHIVVRNHKSPEIAELRLDSQSCDLTTFILDMLMNEELCEINLGKTTAEAICRDYAQAAFKDTALNNFWEHDLLILVATGVISAKRLETTLKAEAKRERARTNYFQAQAKIRCANLVQQTL